jgi:hypothetical protein
MYGIGYGPNYNLYQIDLTTGALVNLGPSVTRPNGLAFAAVPEPTAPTLSLLVMACCLLHRRTCRIAEASPHVPRPVFP